MYLCLVTKFGDIWSQVADRISIEICKQLIAHCFHTNRSMIVVVGIVNQRDFFFPPPF